jgi:hypothetical protein
MKTCRLIPRIFGLFGGILAVLFMYTVAFAAPKSSQPPISHPDPVLSFPDIKAQNLEVDHPSPKPGDIVFLKGSYLVTGCIKKPFFGKITLDGTTLIEQEMKNYDPECKFGNMYDGLFGVSWKATSGTHTVVFTADSKNDIGEGLVNENNNTQTITLTVPFPAIDKIKDMKTKQPIPVPVPGVR